MFCAHQELISTCLEVSPGRPGVAASAVAHRVEGQVWWSLLFPKYLASHTIYVTVLLV